ncbi:MraY family glycosyltransferase [Pseudomonas saponiphila]|uniref:Fuc2NAc and GlcNAc transferase n=1 Tax=Pseudomonas saponiphila TaxID=556534 RepID=A0A1H4L3C3_9PSED|nr:glycosyltransferase family 4 protein [Pseudomonas saponiphila]SEB65254.1 Fuc2NAc and GlcNAc transferase [Pseudomonas saponiphila]
MTKLYLILLFSVACSFIGTAILRWYALSNSLIDVPNARSSHSQPTPRGGGVAIVLSFIISAMLLMKLEALALATMLALVVSGSLVAIIGFLDDHGHIPARWRLLGHFVAAVLALSLLGGMPKIIFFNEQIDLAWFGNVLAVLYLVWMLNLYNFMDGIDGLAGAQAIFVGLGGALLYWGTGSTEFIWGPLSLAFAALGFLYWNFPSARIFMGDAGSGFLGIVLGLLALQAAWVNPMLLWSWLILLGVFIVDATFTLLHRLLRGEKVYEAHRSHAYQFAARLCGRHFPVTVSVALINFLWLLPMAFVVGVGKINGILGVLIAYFPLIFLAFFFKSGQREA